MTPAIAAKIAVWSGIIWVHRRLAAVGVRVIGGDALGIDRVVSAHQAAEPHFLGKVGDLWQLLRFSQVNGLPEFHTRPAQRLRPCQQARQWRTYSGSRGTLKYAS
ncbi:MAG: hypothetical protein IPG64_11185 [Haliea sp.]|nr:hypothetical protein [Haliea sp.]